MIVLINSDELNYWFDSLFQQHIYLSVFTDRVQSLQISISCQMIASNGEAKMRQ